MTWFDCRIGHTKRNSLNGGHSTWSERNIWLMWRKKPFRCRALVVSFLNTKGSSGSSQKQDELLAEEGVAKRKTLPRSSRGTSSNHAGRPKQEILYLRTRIQSSGLRFLLLQLCFWHDGDSGLQVQQQIVHNKTHAHTKRQQLKQFITGLRKSPWTTAGSKSSSCEKHLAKNKLIG